MVIKRLLKYEWYRTKHLRDLVPDEYKEAYDMINSGISLGLPTTLAVLNIVENIKKGNIDSPLDMVQVKKDYEYVKEQFELKNMAK